ncbi:MAG: 4-hydroxythreonine-4-phosphate dehydrogenase PdxA [Tannerellaceae bacterium]|jgi:4-hydroxythreonine-4-phosphate dehydrogenase|nr:4-hydroxythreonine-4-phosphate dehydrogenase PdxA [Tannerellaceae bacterium]
MEENSIRIGITHGDVNGVGYEVILKTICDERITELCTPVIYGSAGAMEVHRNLIADLPPLSFKKIADATGVETGKVNFINCVSGTLAINLGQPSPEAGRAAFESLEAAVADIKGGYLDALLTAPINKDTIQNEGFHFPGHTEYLEKHFKTAGRNALMILMDDRLRVALMTGHVPLANVPSLLDQNGIVSRLRDFDRSLREDFRIVRPRIAVLALNPHAGEQGLLGGEEKAIIIPAIKEAEKSGLLAFGPYPADGFFGSRAYTRFDGVLAMYHDQGLIPFKSLVMKEGVNYTAGLSIVRTSPAHGTAYDIAGRGTASEESFRQALYAAIDIVRNRAAYRQATANPLPYPVGRRFEKKSKSKSAETT